MAGGEQPLSESGSGAEPDSITRTRSLLKAGAAKIAFDPALGYLDLMGGRRAPTTPATIAMQTPLVSAIYERYWRPGLTRLAKGLTGHSMSDEYASASQMLRIGPGDVVLDLACGPGNFTRRFARTAGAEGLVVGYDGSRPMLDRAVDEQGQKDPAPAYLLGEATELPFKAKSFDSVCCFAALHMFPQPLETLDEIVRVLRPGGRLALLITDVSGGGVGSLAAHAFGRLSGMVMFREQQIRDELEARGFEVETQEGAGAMQFVGAVLS